MTNVSLICHEIPTCHCWTALMLFIGAELLISDLLHVIVGWHHCDPVNLPFRQVP
jgi:hypothetical protein